MQINSRPVPLAKFRGRSQIGQQSLPNPTPGSLRITGNWSIQTANNSLLYQQASCGISFFIQYNNYGSPHQGTIFKKGPFNLIINSFSGEAFNMEFTLTSTGNELQYIQEFIYQAIYHIAISWNQSTQQQFAWINGVQVYSKNYNFEASINNQYAWLGWSDGGSGTPIDYQVANFAIWNGYSPTLQDVLKLRDGILNPSQVGRGATAWWPLGGPAGVNPTLVDSGLHDYSGNGNHFLSLAGASTNAVYSGPLTYVSPTLVEPYVAKSGQTVYFFTLSNVPTPLLQGVTTVADNPTVSVNGNPIQINGPYWHPRTHQIPWVAYQLSCGPVQSIVVQKGGSGYTAPAAIVTGGGGSGCVLGTPVLSSGVITSIPVTSPGAGYTAVPAIAITDLSGSGSVAVPVMAGVQASDTVTFSAAASWCTAGSGAAPAATAVAVLNSAGQLEPAQGGYLPFDLPANQRTMLVGSQLNWPHSQSTFLFSGCINWIKRLANPWTNAVTSTPDGHPLTITGTAQSPFAGPSGQANWVDGHGWPVQDGVWTLVVDDTNAANPMQFSLTSGTGNCTITHTFTEGTRVGGSLIGRTWQFTVTRTSTANWNLALYLNATIAGQGGTYNYTATNEALFSPSTSAAAAPGFPSRANLLTLDAAVARMASGQSRYLACLRFVDSANNYGGVTTEIDADDLLNPADFSWAAAITTSKPTGSHTLAITAVRTYAPSGSTGFPAGWSGSVTWTSGPVYLSSWHNAAGYPIDSLRINSGGSGYVAPMATAVPAAGDAGTGCVLGTPVLASGVITSIPVTSAGSGYGSPPSIVITDSGGTGAIAMPMAISSPADPGWITWSGAGASWYCAECVTSAPHNLKTGQILSITADVGTYSVSNGNTAVLANVSIGTPSGDSGLVVFVTSPTTFAFTDFLGSITGGSGSTMPGDINNVAGTFSVTWLAKVSLPVPGTIPWDAAAAMSAAVPGCGIHVNVPVGATDGMVAAIAQRIRDNLPVGRQVIVEYSNENWNYATSEVCTFALGALGAWGSAITALGKDVSYAVRASQIHDLFVSVFNAADINGNTGRGVSIVRAFGSQISGSNHATAIINYANTFNAGSPAVPLQIDAILVAPYIDLPSEQNPDPTTRAAANPTGSGGSLAVGTYFVGYTWIDAVSGAETALGTSESTVFTVTGTEIPIVTIPATPVWASGANIYLTPVNGASGTEVQYATGVTLTTYSLAVANTGTITPPNTSRLPSARLAAASLASGHLTSAAYGFPSPWSRQQFLEFFRHYIKYNTLLSGQLAANLNACKTYTPVGSQPGGFVPALIGYEGGLQTVCNFDVSQVAGANQIAEADGLYLANRITHDCYYDPELYWCDMASFQMNQQAGMSQFNCLSLCMPLAGDGSPWNNGFNLWGNCTWHGQPSGRGDGSLASNGQPVTNLFWIDTGSAQHLNNAAVRLQALQDWADGANAPPPLAPARKWFPGLRRVQ